LARRAQLEALIEPSHHALNLTRRKGQLDAAFVVERMTEADDVITQHISAGADRRQLHVAGENGRREDRAGLEFGTVLIVSAPAATGLQQCKPVLSKQRRELLGK